MSEYIAKCNEVEGISGKPLIVPEYIDVSKEIVRCKDCRLFRKLESGKGLCRRGSIISIDLDGSGFCSWGERKAVEHG